MIISVSPDVAAALHPDKELINFFTSLEFTFDKEPKIGACFKKSGPLGVPYSEFPNFQGWMASWSESRNSAQDFPLGYFRLIGEGLVAALNKGIGVLEPGCGAGRHVMRVAEQFPDSCFTAFDIDVELIGKNKEEAKRRGINNISFVVADFCAMPQEWNGKFDYVMIFDCMHDLPHPAKAMVGLKRILKKDGVVTMLDIDTATDMCKETKKPLSSVMYNISLHHCMSVSLANGGVGLGACWGVELATEMLKEAGWDKDGEIRVITNDIPMHAVYVMKKGQGVCSA